jgi:hypothetical protein
MMKNYPLKIALRITTILLLINGNVESVNGTVELGSARFLIKSE